MKVDDLENYARVQADAAAGDWVSFHRGAGAERPGNGGDTSSALNEAFIRNQYRAWRAYMEAA